MPPPLGSPYGPRHRPIEGTWCEALSKERGPSAPWDCCHIARQNNKIPLFITRCTLNVTTPHRPPPEPEAWSGAKRPCTLVRGKSAGLLHAQPAALWSPPHMRIISTRAARPERLRWSSRDSWKSKSESSSCCRSASMRPMREELSLALCWGRGLLASRLLGSRT